MKRAHKKALAALAAALTLTAAGSVVLAGLRSEADVTIATNGKTGVTVASGALGTARAIVEMTKAPRVEIGCSIETNAKGSSVRCVAANAAGNRIECVSSGAGFVQAATALGSASWMSFTVGLDGVCSALTVDNNSKWKPMVP